ncbi:unnamed protein product [Rhodiola kirilowii]
MAGAAGARNQLTHVPVVERALIREGSVSLTYPMLSKDNYASWAIKVNVFMEAQGVWEAVEPPTGMVVDQRRDKMAMAAIYQGVPEDVLLAIAEKQTAKEVWETLKTMHLGAERVKSAKVQTLRTEFEILRMKDSDSLDEFSMKLSSLVNRIRGLGQQIEEVHVVKKLLRGVSKRFLPIVSTIEQFGDVNAMPLDEAIGRLKAHEERTRSTEDNEGEQFLLTKLEWTSRIKKNDEDMYGHYASECQKKRSDEEADEEANLIKGYDDEPALMMAETKGVVLVNDDQAHGMKTLLLFSPIRNPTLLLFSAGSTSPSSDFMITRRLIQPKLKEEDTHAYRPSAHELPSNAAEGFTSTADSRPIFHRIFHTAVDELRLLGELRLLNINPDTIQFGNGDDDDMSVDDDHVTNLDSPTPCYDRSSSSQAPPSQPSRAFMSYATPSPPGHGHNLRHAKPPKQSWLQSRIMLCADSSILYESLALVMLALYALAVEICAEAPGRVSSLKTRPGASCGVLLGAITLPAVLASKLIQQSRGYLLREIELEGLPASVKLVYVVCQGLAVAAVKVVQHIIYTFPSCASIGEALLVTSGLVHCFGDMVACTVAEICRRLISPGLVSAQFGINRSEISTIIQEPYLGDLSFQTCSRLSSKYGDICQAFTTWIREDMRYGELSFSMSCYHLFISKHSKVERILFRKYYHLMAVCMFLPAVIYQPMFLDLAFGAALAVFLVLEIIRIWRMWPLGQLVHQFMTAFTDHRDSDILIVSHFSLLLGCALPIRMSSGYND